MASLIPGYEYDIFISYRQKDNKYDGWVTEFVNNLKKELEATFKEEISVYFDINPHDGLLETHDVDASLKEKLKCLIFIPIISRTYCDPKSFAWEHEFKEFVEQASQDKFGLKVKLPNGNVASRVLPIRIYDLDNSDIKLCESVLGGVLRGVEFIYSEPGVNRPLRQRDDDVTHTTKQIIYRDQINKVANAIKEIISGLKTEPTELGNKRIQHIEPSEEVHKKQAKETQAKSFKSAISKLFPVIIISTMLVIAAILAYPKIFKQNTLEKLRSSGERISVAVMPFQNLTNDTTTWNVYQKIIQNSLTSSLSNFPQYLQVRQTESINDLLNDRVKDYASITPSFAQKISKTLDADIFIIGDIIKSGNVIRFSSRLIDTKTGEIVKSLQIEGPSSEGNLLPKIDSLSGLVRDFLIISRLKREVNYDLQPLASTISVEAYKYFILGSDAFYKMDMPTAKELFSKAVANDSNFVLAITRLASSCFNLGLNEQGKKWNLKAFNKREQVPEFERLWVNLNYARYFETPYDEIKILKRIMETDDQMPYFYFRMGDIYMRLGEYEKAILEFEKSLDIYDNWEVKPLWSPNYWSLISAYRRTHQFRKEEKLFKKAEKDFPDNYTIIREHAITLLAKGDSVAANSYINKFLSIIKEDSGTEIQPFGYQAYFYAQGNIPDKAEKYYRKALSLKPGDTYNFANFLINTDRNVIEGLELIDKLLTQSPDNYNYLLTKGCGLFKQGKYEEALKTLQRSWDLRIKNSTYNHEAFLHLEAAKKAVAGMK